MAPVAPQKATSPLAGYMFRIVKGQCPPVFMNKLEYVSGGSRSGNNCDLYVSKSKSLKDLKYIGAKCWNSISAELREMEDVKVFSKAYKICFLSSIQLYRKVQIISLAMRVHSFTSPWNLWEATYIARASILN